MVLLSGVEIPIRAIREQIASAIEVIVHTGRMGDGRRAVTSILEVTGMGENQILSQEIYRLAKGESPADNLCLVPTGVPSGFYLGKGSEWS